MFENVVKKPPRQDPPNMLHCVHSVGYCTCTEIKAACATRASCKAASIAGRQGGAVVSIALLVVRTDSAETSVYGLISISFDGF